MTNMDTSALKEKWASLRSSVIENDINSLLLSEECLAPVFIGLDFDGKRCLILVIPEEFPLQFVDIKKEKLSIVYSSDKNHLILSLVDSGFYDLFDDLIISLHNGIKNIESVNKYIDSFISVFLRWSEFFDEQNEDRLTKELVKGLWGELYVLSRHLQESTPIKVNGDLDAWKGPYDQGRDFIFDKKDIEVKTKDAARISIRISSEYQLKPTNGKGLELHVISVIEDPIQGLTLKGLVIENLDLIQSLFGDKSILYKALKQKGLSTGNIHEYDNFRFSPVELLIFDSTKKGFPKLISGQIDDAITGLKYDINLTELDEYLLMKEILNG